MSAAAANAGLANAGLISAALLPALAAGGATLLALALLAALVPRAPVRGVALVLTGLAAVAMLARLALGGAPLRLSLPFDVAGVRPVLALDGLSAFFLLAMVPVGMAALSLRAAPGMLALLGCLVLALLAADAGALALGVAGAGLAAAWLAGGRAALLAALAVPALAVGLALPEGEARFAVLRGQAAAEGVDWLVPALMLAAGAVLAGLAPLHRRLRDDGLVGALLATLGLYVMARAALDLAGPVAAGWAVPLLAGGAGGAVLGALAAVRAAEMRGVLAGLVVARSGLVALALGLAVAARSVDDGPAAEQAVAAGLFLAAALGWAVALGALVAAALAEGAGSARLGRLGGLVHRMRFTFLGALAAGLALAVMPPGAGFAGVWLLVRAAATLPRGGGAEWWAAGLLAVLAVGLAAALMGFAVLRAIGVSFLGRPRSPRAAAAEEVGPGRRWAMIGFGLLLAVCGLVPGAVLALAGPAVAMLAGAEGPGGWLAVQGYAPPGLVLLLALAGASVALLVRLRAPAGHRVAPAWEGGQGPPPTWLPFGDPATQLGAAGFARALRLPRVGWPGVRAWPMAWPRVRALPGRFGPALMGVGLVALLLLHGTGLW